MTNMVYIRKCEYFHQEEMTIIPVIVFYSPVIHQWVILWAGRNREERDDLFQKVIQAKYFGDHLMNKTLKILLLRPVFGLSEVNPLRDVQVQIDGVSMLI